MMVCTFAGHREVFGLGQSQVVEILERLLEAEQEMTCYVGGKGEFDALCASAVRTLKHRHPDKAISLVLVLPYMEQRLNTDKEYYESRFDEILIPIELAGIHYKQAITACNRWMVDRADCLIAMVWRDHGGAYRFTGWYLDRMLTEEVTSVRMTKNVTVYAGWRRTELPFIDVRGDDWFYDDVAYVYENGLMNGTSETTFSPYISTTRGMIVTILYRMEGRPAVFEACPFTDVKAGAYYERAIVWAAENGIVKGYGNGCFGPDDQITREQMAAILYRYAKNRGLDVSVGENTNILSYDDALDISEYAVPAMQWACGAQIIHGADGRLTPGEKATRAQVAAILHRFCENVLKP